MLHIYHIDDPKPISDRLYSEVLKNGEVRQQDIADIFDHQLGRGTYTGHYTNLAKRLRLIEEVFDGVYYVLSEQTAGAIRHSDPGEQLFDILTRLPHFARWVQLTQSNDDEIDYEEAVPAGERKYKMRQQRVEQFESWGKAITEIATETTFDTLQAEYERQSAYIWEDYISIDNIQTTLDPVVLLIIVGAAANCGASCKRNRLLEVLPCDDEEFDTIVDDVLTPVGIPVYESSSCIGLSVSTELRMETNTRWWDEITEIFDSDCEITSLADLTDYLQFETNILDFVDTIADATLQFSITAGRNHNELPSRDPSEDATTELKTATSIENSVFVALPPSITELSSADFFAEIEDMLTAVTNDTEPLRHHPHLEYHIREQQYYLGSIPLLRARNFETLTALGEQYLQQDTTARRELIFDHLLARNPPVRRVIAAADLSHHKIENTNGSWVIRTDQTKTPVKGLLTELSDRDQLTLIGIDSTEFVQQIVSYLRTVGILKGQGTVDRLQLSASVHEHLKQNPRGGRQLLEQSKRNVQSIVEELQ